MAIKVIPVGENDDIEEIQKEIDMLKECDHPNVVHYLVSLPSSHTCTCETSLIYAIHWLCTLPSKQILEDVLMLMGLEQALYSLSEYICDGA